MIATANRGIQERLLGDVLHTVEEDALEQATGRAIGTLAGFAGSQPAMARF